MTDECLSPYFKWAVKNMSEEYMPIELILIAYLQYQIETCKLSDKEYIKTTGRIEALTIKHRENQRLQFKNNSKKFEELLRGINEKPK